MPCKICNIKPVITLTNNQVKLCKSCFFKYFERKVVKTISKYKLLDKKDRVAIAVSGGKDSFSLLYIMNKLAEKRRKLEVIVITIDEGIKGHRDFSKVKKFCEENKIKYYNYNFKKEFKKTLPEIVKKVKLNPCAVCGVLRRYLLNKLTRKLKAKKLATGHNLDDETQSVLMNQFKGDIERSAILGPMTGVIKDERFIPRIKPLYFLLEKETTLYAKLKKFPVKFKPCSLAKTSLRFEIRNMLNKFEEKHPGTKNAIINSFLTILPALKKQFRYRKIKSCKKCGEPCSLEICKTCEFLDSIKK